MAGASNGYKISRFWPEWEKRLVPEPRIRLVGGGLGAGAADRVPGRVGRVLVRPIVNDRDADDERPQSRAAHHAVHAQQRLSELTLQQIKQAV